MDQGPDYQTPTLTLVQEKVGNILISDYKRESWGIKKSKLSFTLVETEKNIQLIKK
jgi:hypothetical protein